MIPKRFEKAEYKDIPENIQVLVKNLYDSRRGIYIFGVCGTGKTHIAYACTKYFDENKIKSWLLNMPEMLGLMKEDFKDENKSVATENTNFSKILNYAGVLIIDDIGSEKITEWVEEMVYAIVNKRYEDVKPTIFTSNLPPEKLIEKYGDRIVSRIVGSCDVVELKGNDKRIQ